MGGEVILIREPRHIADATDHRGGDDGPTVLNRAEDSESSVFLMSYTQPVDTYTAQDRERRDEYQEARRCFAGWIAGRMIRAGRVGHAVLCS
jgi:hypothetical protein